MEKLQSAKKTIEDIVRREHLYKACCIVKRGVEDPGGIDTTPGNYPCHRKQNEDGVAQLPVFNVSAELSQLQQVVSTVVDDQYQGSNPGEVSGPGEHHESYSGIVMYKHLPEILSFDIEELRYGEGPVER